jgi:quinol-cytochrome oxidoreductase complex cytochrome b subunit
MSNLRAWFEERLGLDAVSGFLEHKQVPCHKHSVLYYTGSSALFFLGIQIVSGVLLAFYYQPTLAGANSSVARIVTEMPLGWLVRSVHSWSATFMIAAVFCPGTSSRWRRPRSARTSPNRSPSSGPGSPGSCGPGRT